MQYRNKKPSASSPSKAQQTPSLLKDLPAHLMSIFQEITKYIFKEESPVVTININPSNVITQTSYMSKLTALKNLGLISHYDINGYYTSFASYQVGITPLFDQYIEKYYGRPSHHVQPIISSNKQGQTPQPKKKEIFYEVILDGGSIRLNSIIIKRKFHSDTDRYKIFEYIHEHPNKVLTREEISIGAHVKLGDADRLDNVIYYIGFSEAQIKVFFPLLEQAKIKFRKKVSTENLKALEISPQSLLKSSKKSKTKNA